MRPLPGRSIVAEYGARFDADLARARLADAGLESVVMGDPAYAVAPHHMTDRVFHLVVMDEVADVAREILADLAVDTAGEQLDAAFHHRHFVQRPRWVRATTVLLLILFAGPLLLLAATQLLWLLRDLFP